MWPFKTTFLLLFFCSVIYGCGGETSNNVKRSGEPEIYHVPGDDEVMNRATEAAKNTIKTFDSALRSRNPSSQRFSLKAKFDKPYGAEHIWVGNISINNGRYFGVVDNVPNAIPNLKIGDAIEVNNITDWMYIENGVLRGGYTIRVLRDRMSAEERKAFDAEFGVTIKE